MGEDRGRHKTGEASLTETILAGGDRIAWRPAPLLDRGAVWRLEGRRAALWLPVFLGLGIWTYFALPVEPWAGWALVWLLPGLLLSSGWARAAGWAGVALSAAALACALGFALAKWSSERVAAPVLPWAMTQTVEGRVLELSKSASGAPRVLLDRVIVHGLDPRETPERVRVTLLSVTRDAAPGPGTRLMAYARLSPPGGPVEPGAFDFRFRAWFDRLGAVGYSRTPAVPVPADPAAGPLDAARLWLAERRLRLADALRRSMPGAEGAFAAAIVTGDRSAIAEADAEALRLASLAHLLAISGLHMGILTGLVFAAARLVLAGSPVSARRVSAKKIAALAALAAGGGYLALSGATVATQRAFVMAAVALVAVLLDRPAITLRSLAVAAAVVLALRPASLLEVGFQMSFAATAVLIAGYEVVRDRRRGRPRGEFARGGRVLRAIAVYAGAVLFTSVLAGLATAPYAAWHFNRATPWGLVANLGAVPAMGLVIAPSAVMAGLLAPFGLEEPALRVMGYGIGWVLEVANFVALLPGAEQPVRAAGAEVLALVTFGGLWLCLWRGPWRVLGTGPVALALVLWANEAPRPDLLVAPEARLVGLMGPAGRDLNSDRAQSFAAETWLRRDADPAEQREAAARKGLEVVPGQVGGVLRNGWRVEVVRSRRPPAGRLRPLCRSRTLLIAPHGHPLHGPCLYLGRDALDRMGAVAVRAATDRVLLEAAEGRIVRPWTVPESRLPQQ